MVEWAIGRPGQSGEESPDSTGQDVLGGMPLEEPFWSSGRDG